MLLCQSEIISPKVVEEVCLLPKVICQPLRLLGLNAFYYFNQKDPLYMNVDHLVHAVNQLPYTALWPKQVIQNVPVFEKGIILVDKRGDTFCFGLSHHDAGMIQFLFVHLELIKRFIIYFKSKFNLNVQPLFPKERPLDERREKFYLWYDLSYPITSVFPELKAKFIESVSLKKYQLTGHFIHQHLTEKQLDLLLLLLEGKTAKEIARLLNLSHRTVEGNISRVKNRFQCQNRQELLMKILESGLSVYDKSCQFFYIDRCKESK